ncbi:MAG: non-hydrolyzing UDP-N-acetylglucosamine 2-epimerase [Candidatus Competibacterales bacterium]
MTLLCVVGARPNFMKIAPLMRALGGQRPTARLVHTGQHYDVAMNEQFFRQLAIPEPDVNLEVGSGSHAVQTAEIMRRFEPVLEETPDPAVLVVGDVNSTLACALVAAKRQVPVIHVEAGLRSLDRTMPEEINRVVTDQLSSLLFTTERDALGNLTREGIDPARVHFVGNVMIDTLRFCLPQAVPPATTLAASDLARVPEAFGVVTLHRPSNVDDPAALATLVAALKAIARRLPLLFPLHPRTRNALERADLLGALTEAVILLPPLGYLEMLGLTAGAKLVITDSGGLQEETTALGVPCFTLRDNTERPITLTLGTNTLVGRDIPRLHQLVDEVLSHGGKTGQIPEYWDGRAAERIVEILSPWLTHRATPAQR